MTRAALRYTLARAVLFVLFALLTWSLAGLLGWELNGFLLLVIALVLSSAAGLFLLAGPREALALEIEQRQALRKVVSEDDEP